MAKRIAKTATEPLKIVPTAQDVNIMAAQMREALDPIYLAKRANLNLDPWQAEVVRTRPRRGIILASRQSGKSTVSAVAVLHEAIYNPGSTSLVIAPAERQSKEFLVRVKSLLANLKDAPLITAEGQMHLIFANGSRIIATPGSEQTLRGFTINGLAILDEASRIEPQTYEAVRPMLAVGGGRLLVISTPNGSTGWFYDAWHSGIGAGWQRWKVSAYDCPRITEEFLAAERASLPDIVYRQEYLVEFVDDSSSVFDAAAIRRAFENADQEDEADDEDDYNAIFIPPFIQGAV